MTFKGGERELKTRNLARFRRKRWNNRDRKKERRRETKKEDRMVSVEIETK